MASWNLATLQEMRVTKRIDSEFFHPDYAFAEQRVRKCNVENLGRLGRFVPGPFGSAFHVQNYDLKSPYRYIRGRDVKPFFLIDDDNRYIPEADFRRLSQYEVRSDDLMVSVVGTLGNVAVCTEEEVPAMFSCKSTLFRSGTADPYFLLAYLNSTPGQHCLLRRQRGAIQTGLNMEDLRTIPVPRFSEETEREIAGKVRDARRNFLESREKYRAAEQLIKSKLGLDNLAFQKSIGYTARFSELELTRRFDSEHFSPTFDTLMNKVGNAQWVRLGALVNFCQRGRQPVYSEEGLPVLNSKHILENRITMEGNRYAKPNPISSLQIQYGDVLMNGTGRGAIGRAAPYLVGEHHAMPDNHVTILRSPTLDPVYLSLFLNSLAGKLQVEKHQRGSSGQLELYPLDIKRFWIWVAPGSIQANARLLQDRATECAEKSKKLLEQARDRVEQLIDEAAQS